ncbi:amidohydrolase family protein [Bosea sp. 2YAB26]|uniref:amidohydrolase family protein n=2 Tax=Pseudomonadota TaxID=1224 RepID=UPI003F907124
MTMNRRHFLWGSAAAMTLGAGAVRASARRIFDSHCHIIDHAFPIVPNQGYTPPHYPLSEYQAATQPLGVRAGAIVSGSFHGFDQTYLESTLAKLGKGWVGVTQVPNTIADGEIARLSTLGVRALRFNMFRGRIDSVDDLMSLATRAHAAGQWHAEIYADAAALGPYVDKLTKLPQIVIDHLGMTEAGLPVVLDLVDAGAKVKATGFGRAKLDIAKALERIAARNPSALVFGTDLPSTRAERPFQPADIDLVEKVLGADLAGRAFWDNGLALYRVSAT